MIRRKPKTMSYKSEAENLHKKLYNTGETPVITDAYLLMRFEQSVQWYMKKANRSKYGYFTLSIIGIVLPLSVPVLNYFGNLSLFVTIVSVLASLVTSLLSLLKLHEKWVSYRSVTETLQSELTLYTSKCGDYNDLSEEKRNQLFAEKIEALMGNEHIKWISIVNKKNDDKK